MNKFVELFVTWIAALGSAAIVAYSMTHLANSLGLTRAALREQALICAALITGLVAIEFLASREG